MPPPAGLDSLVQSLSAVKPEKRQEKITAFYRNKTYQDAKRSKQAGGADTRNRNRGRNQNQKGNQNPNGNGKQGDDASSRVFRDAGAQELEEAAGGRAGGPLTDEAGAEPTETGAMGGEGSDSMDAPTSASNAVDSTSESSKPPLPMEQWDTEDFMSMARQVYGALPSQLDE